MTITETRDTMPQRGFTLIEMLIAVALLLLIVSIFGQIFSIATGTIRTQRGISVNDQKARTLDVIIRGDLAKISYKPIPGEDGITPMIGDFIADNSLTPPFNDNDNRLAFDGTLGNHPNMQGYFYISENDPSNDTDDVLQFTVQASVDDDPFFVKAISLPTWTTLTTGNDHPDFDDAVLDNETATSRQAEIAYFMRNGILYRRVMAVRDPLFDEPSSNPNLQPTRILSSSTFEDLFLNSYPASPANNFYTDFDFSAHFDTTAGHVKFNSMADLNDPRNRFGHYRGTYSTMEDSASVSPGFPREYVGSGTGSRFFGRYSHEETSALTFAYPQIQAGTQAQHPLLRNFSAAQAANFEADGRLDDVYAGSRIGEDIIMTNVLSFDVEVWDEALGQFADLGHGRLNSAGTQLISSPDVNEDGIADGDYAYFQYDSNDNGNPLLSTGPDVRDPVIGNKLYGDPHAVSISNQAGPASGDARHFTFDTWSNDLHIAGIGSNAGENIPSDSASPAASPGNASAQPPIRTLKYQVYRSGVAVAGQPSLPLGSENPTPWQFQPNLSTPAGRLQQAIRNTHAVRWQPGLQIKVGDVVVPSYTTIFQTPNGSDPNRKEFYHQFIPDTHRDIIAFRAKKIIEDSATADGFVTTVSEPFWNQIGGYEVEYVSGSINSVRPVAVNYQVSNPTSQIETGADEKIEWEKILNIQPLKAIKLTILFRDVGSDQVRQLSIVHALN